MSSSELHPVLFNLGPYTAEQITVRPNVDNLEEYENAISEGGALIPAGIASFLFRHSRAWVYTLTKGGKVRSVKVGGQLFVFLEDLKEYLTRKQVAKQLDKNFQAS